MTGDPVLIRVRDALREMYGDNIDRIVLFGSRARGDARDDSDYDVAIFLKAMPDHWTELMRLGDLRLQMMDETGAFFDLLPYTAKYYDKPTPLMREVRREGRIL